jgi:hypothetical protein
MWPNHLILWTLVNLKISAPWIRKSSSALLCILQVLSPVHSGPNIFLKLCLTNVQSLFYYIHLETMCQRHM